MAELRETHTLAADEADLFARKRESELEKEYEWVSVSATAPVMINHKLHYTFTVTAGSLV